VPIVEAMAALVLCDHALRQNAVRCSIQKSPHTESTKHTKE
jgi:chorismate synthase